MRLVEKNELRLINLFTCKFRLLYFTYNLLKNNDVHD